MCVGCRGGGQSTAAKRSRIGRLQEPNEEKKNGRSEIYVCIHECVRMRACRHAADLHSDVRDSR